MSDSEDGVLSDGFLSLSCGFMSGGYLSGGFLTLSRDFMSGGYLSSGFLTIRLSTIFIHKFTVGSMVRCFFVRWHFVGF